MTAPETPIEQIDRDKVLERAELLDRDDLLILLSRAFDRLDDPEVFDVVWDYVHAEDVVLRDAEGTDFLSQIEAFHAKAVRGGFYQSFDVNSRNYMQKSAGTENFIAAHHRHTERCVRAAQGGHHDDARKGFELLVDLVRRIDDNPDDIVFFADEAGSWQLGVRWEQLIDAWAATISHLDPDAWAEYVDEHVLWVEYYERDRARERFAAIATADQRIALTGSDD